jgi:hypothetical protein
MADITVTAAKVALVNPDKAEVIDMIAAEALTAGQAVYLTATGKAGLADANAAGKQQCRGIALKKAAAGEVVSVLVKGMAYGFTLAGNYDTSVYLSDNAGALADAAGTMTVVVGRVFPLTDKDLTKVLYVNCSPERIWA